MVLPELRALAGKLGIKGASACAGDLIGAIKERQSGGGSASGGTNGTAAPAPAETSSAPTGNGATAAPATADDSQESGNATRADQVPGGRCERVNGQEQGDGQGTRNRNRNRNRDRDGGEQAEQSTQNNQNNQDKKSDGKEQGSGEQGKDNQGGQNRNRDEDGEGGGRNRRNRRFRERNCRGGGGRDRDGEPQPSEDDVVAPVAGIPDVLDNYAFVRTSGYLAGPNDVYVSMNLVRRYGLRRGDAITGAVKVPREGSRAAAATRATTARSSTRWCVWTPSTAVTRGVAQAPGFQQS